MDRPQFTDKDGNKPAEPTNHLHSEKAPRKTFREHYEHHKRRPTFWIIVTAIIILLIALIWYWLHKAKKPPPQPPVPVTVATSRTADVPVYLSALGSVISIDTITVKTQINGQLLRVLFKEGQLVRAGELLAQIDPRPLLAQLRQFEGQLARDQAQLTNARIDLKRYVKLYPVGAVSQMTYETQKWLVKQLDGTVEFDQGQIDTVKVNLIYANITTPINGRVGLRLVDPGNFVQTTDTTGLFVINVIQPITVVFTIPEDDVPQVLKQMATGNPLLAQAYDRTQNTLLALGNLLTIDNQIDPTTGTVKLKAQFQNEDLRLFPQQFVNIKLLVDTLHNAIVVPTAAIQHGPNGTFVFLLNKSNTVSVKPIVSRITYGDDSAITGISSGQSVVIQGTDKLTDGAKVTLTTEPSAAPLEHPEPWPQPQLKFRTSPQPQPSKPGQLALQPNPLPPKLQLQTKPQLKLKSQPKPKHRLHPKPQLHPKPRLHPKLQAKLPIPKRGHQPYPHYYPECPP
jgi:multidrug efflux system membrane fusion protein